jgi:alanine racemase
LGEEVVLIGKQQGEEITAHEIAQWTETISYEILTGISSRVPREYLKSEGE